MGGWKGRIRQDGRLSRWVLEEQFGLPIDPTTPTSRWLMGGDVVPVHWPPGAYCASAPSSSFFSSFFKLLVSFFSMMFKMLGEAHVRGWSSWRGRGALNTYSTVWPAGRATLHTEAIRVFNLKTTSIGLPPRI
jgi:hypothetical protein